MPIRYIWRTVTVFVILLSILSAVLLESISQTSRQSAAASENSPKNIFDTNSENRSENSPNTSSKSISDTRLHQRVRTTSQSPLLPTAYACPDLLIIQAIVHEIEMITDNLQQTQRLHPILAAFTKTRQRYAASSAQIDQRKVRLLDIIVSIVDPTHRVTQPYLLTCTTPSSRTGSRTTSPVASPTDSPTDFTTNSHALIAGHVRVSGKLLIGDPMPPSGADCRDFPDQCTDSSTLVIPIGIITTTHTPLFEAQQYLPLGCIDAPSTSPWNKHTAPTRSEPAQVRKSDPQNTPPIPLLYQIVYQHLLYHGLISVQVVPHAQSANAWLQPYLRTYLLSYANSYPSSHPDSTSLSSSAASLTFTGYIRPQPLEDRERLPCEGVFAKIMP